MKKILKEQYVSQVNYWLKLILWILIMLPVISYNFTHDKSDKDFYSNLGQSFSKPLLYGVFNYCFAQLNVKLANKIKKSVNWAYFFGFLFAFIGFIGYWIYYKKYRIK